MRFCSQDTFIDEKRDSFALLKDEKKERWYLTPSLLFGFDPYYHFVKFIIFH